MSIVQDLFKGSRFCIAFEFLKITQAQKFYIYTLICIVISLKLVVAKPVDLLKFRELVVACGGEIKTMIHGDHAVTNFDNSCQGGGSILYECYIRVAQSCEQ